MMSLIEECAHTVLVSLKLALKFLVSFLGVFAVLQVCYGGRQEELARRSLILCEPGRKSGLHPQLSRARQVSLVSGGRIDR